MGPADMEGGDLAPALKRRVGRWGAGLALKVGVGSGAERRLLSPAGPPPIVFDGQLASNLIIALAIWYVINR